MSEYKYRDGTMRGHFYAQRDGKQYWVHIDMPGSFVEVDGLELFVHRVGMPKDGVLYLLEKGWVVSDPASGRCVSSAREGSANRATAIKNALEVIERVGRQQYMTKVMLAVTEQEQEVEKGTLKSEQYAVQIVSKFPT